MKTKRKNAIALFLITRKIKITFSEPDSAHSIRIAKGMAEATGISYLEIHRFHNAVIRDNLERSFSSERASIIAYAMMKEVLRKQPINAKNGGQISEFANEVGISFNELLEYCRAVYTEIIEDVFRAQSVA